MAERTSRRTLCFGMGYIPCHWTDRVREIGLVFVPTNGTAIYKPCDLLIMGILKKILQMEWEIARLGGRNKVVWNKGSTAVVCSSVFLNNISLFAIGKAWRAIGQINDPDYYVAEKYSDVDESNEASDFTQ